MKNKPDFIVDSSGKASDIRRKKSKRVKLTQEKTEDSGDKTEARKNHPSQNRSVPGRGVILIPIGLIIAIFMAVGRMLFPSSPQVTPQISSSYSSSYQTAINAFLSDNYDLAHMEINLVIFSNPGFSQGYNIRGLIYAAEGEYVNAFADFDKAIALAPGSPDTYNNRGVTYMETGDTEKAIADFNQAIQLQAKFAKPYFNRGLVYLSMGKLDSAIADFDKSIEYSHDSGIRSTPSDHLRDFEKSLLFYGTSVDFASAYYYRGLAHLLNGETVLADLDFEKAREYGFDPGTIEEIDPSFDYDLPPHIEETPPTVIEL